MLASKHEWIGLRSWPHQRQRLRIFDLIYQRKVKFNHLVSKNMKHSSILLALPLLLAGCGVTRIVTVAPAPEPVVVTQPATTVVVAQPQPQVVYTSPVSTTVTYPRTHTTRTTTIDVTPLTSDISLYLDLQAVAAAFAQASTVEEFEMILNSNSYIISNLDLNRDGYIDYLRVLETLEGRTHVLLIQAVLAANIYQDVATLVVEMGYSTPYVQVIGAPYIYGANYIIEPVYYKRPPLFDRFGRPTYAYWRSPYYWDHYPKHYGHHAPYHLGHYQAYVTTFMEHHHYCALCGSLPLLRLSGRDASRITYRLRTAIS